MITSSKDLNARGNEGWSDLHCACIFVRTETVEVMVKNWKEFGMDIKGFRFSVITKIRNRLGITMQETVYCKMDNTEHEAYSYDSNNRTRTNFRAIF